MPEASTLEELNPFSDEVMELRDEINDRLRLYNDYHRDAEGVVGLNIVMGDNGLSVDNRITTVTADTTLDGTNKFVLVNLAATDITITLPAAADHEGIEYYVKNIGAITNNIILDADGTETINGALTQTFNTGIHVVCDGSNWYSLP